MTKEDVEGAWARLVGRQVRTAIERCLNQIFWIFTGNKLEAIVSNPQKRAIQKYRSRLSARGLSRFEVLGRDADRDLLRSLARRLAEEGPDALRLRAAVSQAIADESPKKGGILAALRRSPLVGADLDVSRPREEGRDVQL